MPLPVIGWVIAGVVSAVAAAYGAYKYNSDEEFNSEEESKKYEFESTILIGAQKVGKTHLANWLNFGKLLNEYIPTTNEKQIGSFLDIRGGEIQVNDWENKIKDKKNIFYLLDMEKFINEEEYASSSYDNIVINHISIFTENFTPKGLMDNKNLIIIGTHLDKIDEDRAQKIIDRLHNELDNLKIIYGSLKTEEDAFKLQKDLEDILKEL
ncbi:hypothetical protein [Aliarcobacter butzleri]|uniref:hypothetical protein n=1 Tax=Aliarcobacter butzleri TaxID=28197 RepID=UPI003AF95496